MLRILLGFTAGVFYGAISATETPNGNLAKIATLIKVLWGG
jgi:hypothetical protein